MSHFTVIVFGDDVDGQLAPFHEFECTGVNDEYVQTIDITQERRQEYEGESVTMLKDADGVLHEPYEDRFFREPTKKEEKEVGLGSGFSNGLSYTSRDWGDGKGYRAKVRFVPEGFEQVEVPRKETESFAEFLIGYHGHKAVPFGEEPDIEEEHKYGYFLQDEQGNVLSVFDRTNPNAKWDWWVIGGRWRGFFRLKDEVFHHPDLIGEAGVFDNAPEFDADQARLGDIDIEGMRDIRGRQAGANWDRAQKVFGDTAPVPSWREFVEQMKEKGKTIDDAREAYRRLPRMVAVHKHDEECSERKDYDDQLLGFSGDIAEYQVTRDEYVQKARDRALKPFAYVHEGQWIAPGEMGWWAISTDDEENRAAFTKAFNELLDSLPDDTLLTLTDCHI